MGSNIDQVINPSTLCAQLMIFGCLCKFQDLNVYPEISFGWF